LREQRLAWVHAALLADPAISIAELAAQYGWCDSAHLIRDFKAAYGITPGALQSALRQA
jgi:AraC-like DNA-binding protein